MTTDRQVKAVAEAIKNAKWKPLDEKAKAAIEPLRTELCAALHEGGIKHPQQAEWDVMLEEVKRLREAAESVPMLVEALREIQDVGNLRANSTATKVLNQLPEELRK